MLIEEANWVADFLGRLPVPRTIVNLGSQSEQFRKIDQPWIDEIIFAPLVERGSRVIHVDLFENTGVDIVGDLTDPMTARRLANIQPQVTICCNLLEHVTSRAAIVDAIHEIVPEHGILIVSVPRRYPYHPDPIDTMFRPTVEELRSIFESFELVDGSELSCGRVWKQNNNPANLLQANRRVIGLLMRSIVPYRGFEQWRRDLSRLPYLLIQYRVTVAALRRVTPLHS